MTLAAIERLVQSRYDLEMSVESYHRREALDRKGARGWPPAHATIESRKLIDALRQSKRLPRRVLIQIVAPLLTYRRP